MGRSVQVLLTGNDELRQWLRDLPEALQREARLIVHRTAQDAAADLRAVYPAYGPLQGNVFVTDRSSRLQERWVVESRSKEAAWWEFGTQNRRTQQGWNRGAAPAHPDRGLVTIAIRHRKQMRAELMAMRALTENFTLTEAA